MTRWLVLAIAACGAPPARPHEPVAAPAPIAPAGWRFRVLELGSARQAAQRTAFELTFAGDAATLVETHDHAKGSFTLATVEHDAAWRVTGTLTYRGTRRDVPGAIELDLAAAGVQPLHLRCSYQALQVAGEGARPLVEAGTCGDRGLAEPSQLVGADALVCGEATQPAGGDDDDDRLIFAAGRGLERIDEHDGCLTVRGLRRAHGEPQAATSRHIPPFPVSPPPRAPAPNEFATLR